MTGPPLPYTILGAGMLSSSIAQFASYPLALVRTRLQVCAFPPAALPDDPRCPALQTPACCCCSPSPCQS